MWPKINLVLLLFHRNYLTHITIVQCTYLCIFKILPMFVQEEHHLEVEIETGMNDGMESKFDNKGELHMDNEPGDLILKITTEPFSN